MNIQVNRTVFHSIRKKVQTKNYCTASSNKRTEHEVKKRDPLEYFLKEKVQKILVSITELQNDKYFAEKKVHNLQSPEYKLLTDDEVAVEQERYFRRAKWELKMPPMMNPREEIDKTVSKDPEIADAVTHKMGFIDITHRLKNRNRRILTRDTDGTLRHATWDERDRWTQIFIPTYGRKLFPPRMFQEQQLEEILPRQNYLYILERASIQYEPDHPDYIRVSQRVYDHILTTGSFDELRSTRYFGSMAFYFCWKKRAEPLLVDMLNRELLSHASQLIYLYDFLHHIRHRKEEDYRNPLAVVKDFCEKDSNRFYRGQLELAISSYEAKSKVDKQQQASAS